MSDALKNYCGSVIFCLIRNQWCSVDFCVLFNTFSSFFFDMFDEDYFVPDNMPMHLALSFRASGLAKIAACEVDDDESAVGM